MTKWFLQPGLNFMKSNYFWCSLATRLSAVKYSKVLSSYYDDELSYFRLAGLGGRTLVFLEPSFNMQIGVPRCRWMKISAGFTLSELKNYQQNGNGSYYSSRESNFYIGLDFNFSKLFKK